MLVLAIVALEVPLAQTFSDRVSSEIRAQALGQAGIVAGEAADLLAADQRAALAKLAGSLARSTRGRVIVVDARGRLLVDSAGSRELGDDYSTRPEIVRALGGQQFVGERDSQTLDERLLVTAVPVLEQRVVAGAVRVTQSVAAARRAERRVIVQLVLVGGVVLIVGLGMGALIAGQIAAPMRRLEAQARRVAGGDLHARAEIEGSAEQRSLAASFNEMTRRLTGLLGAQQRFVADASHQLRTPLAALRLRLEEARAGELDADSAEQLDHGLHEVDRLARTIDELLVLSEAQGAEPRDETADVAAAVRAAAQRWGPYAHERDIELDAQAPDEPAPARFGGADLARVLDALIENAVHYSPAGTRVTVTVAGGAIEVADEGPGFDPDEIELVFERFHRGRASRGGAQGTGLGLAIARELARRWSAELTVANQAGGGAVARLALATLPALNQPPPTLSR